MRPSPNNEMTRAWPGFFWARSSDSVCAVQRFQKKNLRFIAPAICLISFLLLHEHMYVRMLGCMSTPLYVHVTHTQHTHTRTHTRTQHTHHTMMMTMMMMTALITIKGSLVPLIEGQCAQIYFRFEILVVLLTSSSFLC